MHVVAPVSAEWVGKLLVPVADSLGTNAAALDHEPHLLSAIEDLLIRISSRRKLPRQVDSSEVASFRC